MQESSKKEKLGRAEEIPHSMIQPKIATRESRQTQALASQNTTSRKNQVQHLPKSKVQRIKKDQIKLSTENDKKLASDQRLNTFKAKRVSAEQQELLDDIQRVNSNIEYIYHHIKGSAERCSKAEPSLKLSENKIQKNENQISKPEYQNIVGQAHMPGPAFRGAKPKSSDEQKALYGLHQVLHSNSSDTNILNSCETQRDPYIQSFEHNSKPLGISNNAQSTSKKRHPTVKMQMAIQNSESEANDPHSIYKIPLCQMSKNVTFETEKHNQRNMSNPMVAYNNF